ILPGGSTSPRMESPVTDLPEPDSPASPRISPGASVNDTPSTAFATPWRVWNQVRRASTSRRGAVLMSCDGRERGVAAELAERHVEKRSAPAQSQPPGRHAQGIAEDRNPGCKQDGRTETPRPAEGARARASGCERT